MRRLGPFWLLPSNLTLSSRGGCGQPPVVIVVVVIRRVIVMVVVSDDQGFGNPHGSTGMGTAGTYFCTRELQNELKNIKIGQEMTEIQSI
jgi:hypothetical protein